MKLLIGFVSGTIFGIVLATVGAGGVAKMLDSGIDKTKSYVKEAVK